MPQNTRRLSAQQRAHHRKLRSNVAERPTGLIHGESTVEGNLPLQQSSSPQDISTESIANVDQQDVTREMNAPPIAIPPAIARRRTRASQITLAGNVLLVKELRRIAILSVVLFATLFVLTFSLR